MIIWSFRYIKNLWQGSIWWKHVSRKHIFYNGTSCKYCFSMSRDKMLFVIELQKLKKQQDTPNFCSAILHKEMNTSQCGKLILMTTGYFLRWRPSYRSFPGPPLSKVAVESNFSSWGRSGCEIPYQHALQFPWVAPAPYPILGQTIDRCIGTERAWTSVILAGKRCSRRHSTTGFIILCLGEGLTSEMPLET